MGPGGIAIILRAELREEIFFFLLINRPRGSRVFAEFLNNRAVGRATAKKGNSVNHCCRQGSYVNVSIFTLNRGSYVARIIQRDCLPRAIASYRALIYRLTNNKSLRKARVIVIRN